MQPSKKAAGPASAAGQFQPASLWGTATPQMTTDALNVKSEIAASKTMTDWLLKLEPHMRYTIPEPSMKTSVGWAARMIIDGISPVTYDDLYVPIYTRDNLVLGYEYSPDLYQYVATSHVSDDDDGSDISVEPIQPPRFAFDLHGGSAVYIVTHLKNGTLLVARHLYSDIGLTDAISFVAPISGTTVNDIQMIGSILSSARIMKDCPACYENIRPCACLEDIRCRLFKPKVNIKYNSWYDFFEYVSCADNREWSGYSESRLGSSSQRMLARIRYTSKVTYGKNCSSLIATRQQFLFSLNVLPMAGGPRSDGQLAERPPRVDIAAYRKRLVIDIRMRSAMQTMMGSPGLHPGHLPGGPVTNFSGFSGVVPFGAMAFAQAPMPTTHSERFSSHSTSGELLHKEEVHSEARWDDRRTERQGQDADADAEEERPSNSDEAISYATRKRTKDEQRQSDSSTEVLDTGRRRIEDPVADINIQEAQKPTRQSTEKPSKACPICGLCFTQTGHVNQHVQIVHEKKRPHVCRICDRAYGTRSNLVRHIRMVHEKNKAQECSICGRCFAESSDMRRHIRTVHRAALKDEDKVQGQADDNHGDNHHNDENDDHGDDNGDDHGDPDDQPHTANPIK